MDSEDVVLAQDAEFVSFDIPRDVLASLTLLAHSLERAPKQDLWWKWAVVSAHMAANSALVGFLSHTSGVGPLSDESTRKLLVWNTQPSARSDPPPDRIAEFTVLLERTASGAAGFGAPLRVMTLVEPLTRLNWVRGRFNHFRDEGWLIEREYLRPLLLAAIDLVDEVFQHGWAFRHGSDDLRSELTKLLMQVRGALEAGSQQLNEREGCADA